MNTTTELTKKRTEDPIDRAQSALAALRATESLIGQVGQMEDNGSDLSLLLSLIINNLGDAIEDMHQQTRQLATDAPKGGAAMSAATKLPGAWYDLSGRISSASSISSCALEALPNGLQGLEYERMNHASNLIAALQDVLDLAAQDVDRMEQQMKSEAAGGAA